MTPGDGTDRRALQAALLPETSQCLCAWLRMGMERACDKRPVSPGAIEEAVERISAELHSEFDGEVPGQVIGERAMNELRALDEVAYVRYASVYGRFEEATDFLQAVKKLEVPHDTATYRLPGF